jgi:hypothetical protein
LNDVFTFEKGYFDLVQSRLVTGGINKDRWKSYIQDLADVLKPGGWLQSIEILFQSNSANDSLPKTSALSQWSRRYNRALNECKDPKAPLMIHTWMEQAGLVDVEVEVIPFAFNEWPDGESYKPLFISEACYVHLLKKRFCFDNL